MPRTLPYFIARSGKNKGSLGQRMANASIWTVGTLLGINFLRFFSNILTTRLLAPEAFALIAIAIAIEIFVGMFVDLGVGRSVQREKDGATPDFLRVAWTVQITLMSFVACALLLLAGCLWLFADSIFPTGSVYRDPMLPSVLAVIASLPMLKALQSTNIIVAVRDLNFRLVGILRLCATVTGIIAMITFLLISPTVWGLVFGMIVNAILMILFTHTLIPGPSMSLAWNGEIFSRIWSYGRFVLGASPLNFIHTQGDRLILGALLDTTTFGLFAIARVWVSALETICSSICNGVGFSGLSKVFRTNPAALPSTFLKVHLATDIMYFASFAAFALGGPILVDAFYTDTYSKVGDILVLLSLVFLFGRTIPSGQYLLTVGKSKQVMYCTAIRAVSLVAFSITGFHFFGLKAALFGIGLSFLTALPFQMVVVGSDVPGYNRREVLWCALYIVGSLAVLCLADL